jgi:hypothetical protein
MELALKQEMDGEGRKIKYCLKMSCKLPFAQKEN